MKAAVPPIHRRLLLDVMFKLPVVECNFFISKCIIDGDGNLLMSFVLVVGIKVASWGAYLLRRDILAMSFAPRDTHEAQVQFALERGVPAMIGIMASQRLPYPARAFDMAHCSRCLIPWHKYGKHLCIFVNS
jgi:hypothetical protein